MPPVRIGCSGWNYKTWRGSVYPAGLPSASWLTYYTSIFDTVEVNNTFYRLPEASTFAAWRETTPRGFVMAVKASRYLTHLKRLRDPQEPIARLFERAASLGSRLGPILYQLPPAFPRDLPRLTRFIAALPRRWPVTGPRGVVMRRLTHVIEFRDPSWYVPDIFDLLRRRRVALCLHDKRASEIAEPLVGPIAYVRFHGTSGHYHGSYDDAALRWWAARLREWQQEGTPVFAYFNNDPDGVAVKNALTLRRLMSDSAS
jgi:uncharacterized protein YecE (DUF72 family)